MAEKPTYIMVSRKLIHTWLVVTAVQFILIIASFQYANWVDSRSNRQLCGVISLFNETYKNNPPPTKTGKVLASEFIRVYGVFKCK